MKFWKRIKIKVLAFGILMSIIPLVSLAYLNVRAAEKDLLVSIQQRNTDLVKGIAMDIGQLISEIEDKISAAGNVFGEALLQQNRESQEKFLYIFLRDIPAVEDISLLDERGREVARVSKREVITPQKLSQVDPELLSKEGMVKSYQTADRRTMVSLIIPVKSLLTREIKGGFYVQVNLRPVMNTVLAKYGNQDGDIFVVNNDGKLIAHEDFSQVLRQTPVNSSLAVRRFMEGKEYEGTLPLRYVSFNGEKVLGVYAPIKKLGWAAVMEIPVREAYKPITALKFKFLIITFFVVVLVVITSILFALRFTKPIEVLEQGARRVAAGDLNFVLPKTTDDEIGQLVDAFNFMTQQIKQKSAELIQTEKMAALGLLAAGVAHEINNPLATVSAYAEDLLERIAEEDVRELHRSGELARYLQVIGKQIERCKKITGSLLNFARQPAGHMIDINLNELLEDTLALVNHRIKQLGIQVEKEFNVDLPVVKGDLSQLQQVLLNIIGNALDAMETTGGRLKLVTEKREKDLVIKIIDTGTGIAQEELKRVFDPFYTTKPLGKGTGLGLSICYGIVKEMKGDIQISSSLGKGTTVTIILPMERKEGEKDEGNN
ncbi:sensor histidine kinase [Carboxydothermus hydrogenoformans]|uniref:histidine kinase n=1 Tax=Carboxydothermus hydrogenoformans (strain ATCC BAA-161 / DSM 6008 / Z-2901) TaxID=246194 RepID=Q3AB08_CARHZ|nr:sensor histidine kinase [Carboxydothermus hydrogenoformans]ABB16226.1 sensor histidine kinase [Carboxydothermus hydrogenoformans Z-2901]